MTPDARTDSGHLDVCLFRDASIPGLVQHRLARAGAARSRRAATCVVTDGDAHRDRRRPATSPRPVQIDGDAWGKTPIEITRAAARRADAGALARLLAAARARAAPRRSTRRASRPRAQIGPQDLRALA